MFLIWNRISGNIKNQKTFGNSSNFEEFFFIFNPHQFIFMKKLLLLASAIITFSFANAQYDMAIGAIYAKDGIGLSYKQFLQPEQNIVINAMYSQNNDDFGGLLVGLYEFHKEIHASTLHTTQLSWSFGGGLHTGYWVTKGNYVPTAFKFGLDGVLGLEYNLDFIPLTIGAQVRPYVQYNSGQENYSLRYYDVDYGVIVRYIIR